MAYDEALAERVLAVIGSRAVTRRMFGGLAFLVGGRMAVCADSRGGLMVRVDPADEAVVAEPVVMRGRPMSGWVHVPASGLESDDDLRAWVARGVARAAAVD